MAVRFKVSTLSLPVLCLETDKLSVIVEALSTILADRPNFMKGATLLVSLAHADLKPDWKALDQFIQTWGGKLVGILEEGLGSSLQQQLPPFLSSFSTASASKLSLPSEQVPPRYTTQCIQTPIRSGQRIYAQKANLVIFNSVGHGAELVADGSIYVYGPLRGRALAGALGDRTAHICVTQLHSELLSIAGLYWLSDRVPKTLWGNAVRLTLKEDQLTIQPLLG